MFLQKCQDQWGTLDLKCPPRALLHRLHACTQEFVGFHACASVALLNNLDLLVFIFLYFLMIQVVFIQTFCSSCAQCIFGNLSCMLHSFPFLMCMNHPDTTQRCRHLCLINAIRFRFFFPRARTWPPIHTRLRNGNKIFTLKVYGWDFILNEKPVWMCRRRSVIPPCLKNRFCTNRRLIDIYFTIFLCWKRVWLKKKKRRCCGSRSINMTSWRNKGAGHV